MRYLSILILLSLSSCLSNSSAPIDGGFSSDRGNQISTDSTKDHGVDTANYGRSFSLLDCQSFTGSLEEYIPFQLESILLESQIADLDSIEIVQKWYQLNKDVRYYSTEVLWKSPLDLVENEIPIEEKFHCAFQIGDSTIKVSDLLALPPNEEYNWLPSNYAMIKTSAGGFTMLDICILEGASTDHHYHRFIIDTENKISFCGVVSTYE